MTDYSQFVKKLPLPDGFEAPHELRYDDLVARAITRDDVAEDVRGINASMDLIRRTRGGRWPTEPVTESEIIVDEYWHECEFRDNKSFTYVLRDDAGGYLGCAYLYPMGLRRPLTEDLAVYDVDVSWWVTPDAYATGYYEKAYRGLRRWVVKDYPFTRPFYSNVERPPEDRGAH
ncbi:GNAT family N-acetyltransferase [Phytoactinopolyspora halotolerans]|uniref:GNAT family N-acetyltransferase n=1 Tax=Phytoactinopolyspora halotolerans TaxID=1981512 RepID=A0A6L9SBL2_9ACTN|nr:GNAT family N-acetyltransferase [Phytoactinopolyspora halotolerans]NEE02517.1 GNAT family N-acetyltransferase [Phytoactinopolyspora halotolerans]